MDNNKIYFSIPGFYAHYDLITEFLRMYIEEREKFYDDIIIDSVYDCFPCIWNGGRYITGSQDLDNVKKTILNYDEKISLRLTFTNALLDEQHFNDTFCNAILKELQNTKIQTGITLNNNKLKEYIENKYPNIFYFNWSATKCLEDIDEINKLSKDNLVIPSYQKINNNFNLLKKLKYPNNIELIVNESCNNNCPNRKTHYENFNKRQLFLTNENETCIYQNAPFFYQSSITRKHNISIDNIRKNYLPLGFNKFKIAGREMGSINLIESLIFYLIKPEFQNDTRNKLLIFIYGAYS